jgi:hypothetical protein
MIHLYLRPYGKSGTVGSEGQVNSGVKKKRQPLVTQEFIFGNY